MNLQRLATALAPIATSARIDLEVHVDDDTFVVRFDGARTALVPEAQSDRRVTLRLTRAGADRVAAGTANAQQLLAEGTLQIGGRIDVLQEQAGALAELGT